LSWRTRSRSNGGVSYDARTGFKVEGRKLREDAEKPGVWTTDPDPIHPQRFIRTPGPDGAGWRPGAPANHAIPAKIKLKTNGWTIANGFAQRPMLFVRANPVLPGAGLSIGVSAAFHLQANPVTVTVEDLDFDTLTLENDDYLLLENDDHILLG
jgi:hypothetical protein